jgi:hypothetical protein
LVISSISGKAKSTRIEWIHVFPGAVTPENSTLGMTLILPFYFELRIPTRIEMPRENIFLGMMTYPDLKPRKPMIFYTFQAVNGLERDLYRILCTKVW